MAKKSIDQMRDEIVEFIIANEEHRMQKINEEEMDAGEEELSYPLAEYEYDEELRDDAIGMVGEWSDEKVEWTYNEGKEGIRSDEEGVSGQYYYDSLAGISGGWRISNLGHLPTDLRKEAKEQYAGTRKQKVKGAKLM